MVIDEDRIIQNFIEKQIKTFKEITGAVLFFSEPEDDLESYIKAEYINGVIEPMVAYEVSSAVNRGRDNAIKSIDGINIAYAEWSANLEGNPCPFCEERNGMIVSVNDPDYANCQPPAHINCECVWVYITDEERTGEGELITPDWIPPDDDDRLKFRMFDVYNTNDLEKLAQVYGEKGVRLAEKQEKMLQNKIEYLKEEKIKQEEVRLDILNDKYLLTINDEIQNKHIQGTKEYNPTENKGILIEDAQELINKYAGKGRIIVKGEHFPKEKFKHDRIIGKWYNKKTGEFIETNWGFIIYSKTGTHVYPVPPDR